MIKKEKEKRKLEVEKGNLGWGKNPGIGIINIICWLQKEKILKGSLGKRKTNSPVVLTSLSLSPSFIYIEGNRVPLSH